MTSPQPNAITRPPVELFGTYPGYGFAGPGVNTAIGNFTLTTADGNRPAGAAELPGGRVEVTIGEPEQWLPGHPDRAAVENEARRITGTR